ncbi:cyclic nucleotide-gated ion channel 1 [Ziziphus jujuba]|uniref:Cyclic nucleotide-gated ion channel 1 n=1 Tax=Ziziphus jujuba TaxID=326968 RepID=A0ABM4AGM5_ZIZJJ|nr:cyclic nucleotide-gated ion channel 1 [Ziziphus jujuba]
MDKRETAGRIPKETGAAERVTSPREHSRKWKGLWSWSKVKEFLDPKGPNPSTWNNIFLFSCVIAVSIDPLFFYIPLINEEKKCFGIDNKLKNVALVLRSVTDVSYILHIIFQIRARCIVDGSGISKRNGCVANVLEIVIILQFFFKVRGTKYLNTRKFLIFIVLSQYVPRVLRIYLSCEQLRRIPSQLNDNVWAKGAFNFFLYITASHVLGAFWYFLSIQRKETCWEKACEKQNGCFASTFDCKSKTSGNKTFLNELCPVNPPNATVFDFGIFLHALDSGMLGSKNFPKKFFQSFWWGLRNLSSFGQNLETSTNVWETCFAALISIMGLLLFLYLIGNLQTYLQLATIRSGEIRQKMKMKEPEVDLWISNHGLGNIKPKIMQHIQYILERDRDIHDSDLDHLFSSLPFDQIDHRKGVLCMDELKRTYRKFAATRSEEKKQQQIMKELNGQLWIDKNDIPSQLKPIIMMHVQCRLQDNKDVHLENILSILPLEHRKSIKLHLGLPILKKVPGLQNMDDRVFEVICEHLKPVVYSEGSYIFREGEPLDSMVLVTQGVVWNFKASINGGVADSTSVGCLKKGDFYGEELLGLILRFASFSNIPISTKNVKSHTRVEALALTAVESKHLATTNWWLFRKKLTHSTESELQRLEPLALSAVKEVRRRLKSRKPKESPRFPDGSGSSQSISTAV